VNAAGRSSASRSSNRNYRRNQRASTQADPGLPPSIASHHRSEARPCAVPIAELGGIEGRAALHVRLMTSPMKTAIPNTTNAAPCHLVGVTGRRRNRLCSQASMRSKFTSMATPRSTSTRPRPTAMRRIVQRRTSVVKEVPANPQTAPSPTPDRLRGGPDATGGAVGMLREADRGQPPA
jgi:hypothetical protein